MHPFASFLLVALTAAASPAARLAPSTPSFALKPIFIHSDQPRSELRLGFGIWNLKGGGGDISGGVIKRRTDWLSTDISLDIGRPDEFSPRYGLLTVGVQLAPPESIGSPLPSFFVEVGEGAAAGLSFTTSPFVAIGIQHWRAGILATRVEGQVFLRGHGLRDSGRVLLSLVIALE